jgi:hypothetical protein
VDASLYRTSRSGRPPLRIGLLLEAAELPRCFAEVVDHIAQSDFAAIELLVFNRAAAPVRAPRSTLLEVIDALLDRGLRRRLLFTLYERWDRRHADPATDPIVRVDCAQRLAQYDALHVDPIVRQLVHRFPDAALERIRATDLDVLIHFGSHLLGGEILEAARYGVWSYHHGDSDRYGGGPAYFWELVEGNPVCGAVLQVLAEGRDAGEVLYKGRFATHPGLSQVRNRVQPYWGASTFMIQKLRELHLRGWDHVKQAAVKPAADRGMQRIRSLPSNAQMVRWLVPVIANKAWRRLVRRPMARHWRIALRVGSTPLPDSPTPPDMTGFRWIDSPKGHAYADPFVVEEGGTHWLYFEDCDYATQLGRISCAQVRNGALGEPRTALERPYHLSYPCVFRDGDAWYMIPESATTGTIQLYRCTRFPDRWKFERALLRAWAVDTTAWIENGVYWFFVTFLEPRGGASQLWLYSASSLEDEWTPHPANPLSTDARSSRGGGAIFRHQGRLFRPSQDCSGEYGRSMTLNEIVVMDPQRYREEPHITVEPFVVNERVCTHTYGIAGAVEVIDGNARVRADGVL